MMKYIFYISTDDEQTKMIGALLWLNIKLVFFSRVGEQTCQPDPAYRYILSIDAKMHSES